MIQLFKPSIGKEEAEAVGKVMETGWIGLGPRTAEFEEKFSKYVGAKRAVGLNSATAALDLALKAFGISGGEVLVPSMTFISTAHAVLYNNAKPVFVDVNLETLCMDVADLKSKVTDKTKAIIPVHYAGHPCDMDEIHELARAKGLIVIEDAAQASGAEYRGRKIGGMSDATCFSFEAKKNMTTGDGGMLTTNNNDIADKVKRLRWFGINKDTWQRARSGYSWYYEVAELGHKSHMNDIQAAIGLVQLAKLDALNAKRKRLFDFYNESFKDLKGIGLPMEKPYVKSAHWHYVIKVPDRDKFMAFLQANGIETGVHYMPVHMHPLYKNMISSGAIPKPKVPLTEAIWTSMVTLPSYADITDEGMRQVADAVRKFFGK
jgi:perosamine synthetase